ncbi:MAG: Gfo/Idh/MocA family oxidoreductase [Anaerolineae bacterium]
MSDLTPVKIGIIGVGNISPAYIKGCSIFDILQIDACADLNMDRARAIAAEYNIPRALTVDELLADPEIEIVLNLTIPAVHAQVTQQILMAGKNAYSEKPLGINLDEARKVVELAKTRNLRVGCAPDNILYAEYQMVRKLLDDGAIGTPVAATAFFASRGPEGWHPNPDFLYQVGAGPLLDMGPYYIAVRRRAARISGAGIGQWRTSPFPGAHR